MEVDATFLFLFHVVLVVHTGFSLSWYILSLEIPITNRVVRSRLIKAIDIDQHHSFRRL